MRNERGCGRLQRSRIHGSQHLRRTVHRLISQGLDQRGQRVGLQIDIGQAPSDGIACPQKLARQRKVFAHKPRATRQKVAASDVRKQPNVGLRHRQLAALGDDANLCALADAHAATHDHAVHQRHIRLGVVVDEVVERVFLGEKVFQARVASVCGLMEKTNVATSTKGHALAFLRGPANHHCRDRRVIAPRQQSGCEVAHHAQRQRVQGLRPVQSDEANLPGDAGDDLILQIAHVPPVFAARIPTTSLTANVSNTTEPPSNTCCDGCSLLIHQTQAMPNTVSSSANKEISGAGK